MSLCACVCLVLERLWVRFLELKNEKEYTNISTLFNISFKKQNREGI